MICCHFTVAKPPLEPCVHYVEQFIGKGRIKGPARARQEQGRGKGKGRGKDKGKGHARQDRGKARYGRAGSMASP